MTDHRLNFTRQRGVTRVRLVPTFTDAERAAAQAIFGNPDAEAPAEQPTDDNPTDQQRTIRSIFGK